MRISKNQFERNTENDIIKANKYRKGVDSLARLNSMIYKLQKALSMRGRIICINQSQFYVEKLGKMVTKYTLQEDGEKILETFRTIEIVQFLANELNGG